MIKPLLLSAALALPLPTLAQEIPLAVVDASGNLVCNEAGAYSALPGYPGYFIGRVQGTPTKTWCGGVNTPPDFGTLAIFQISVAKKQMVMQYELLPSPATLNGVYVQTFYDPTVMVYNGEIWVATECTPHTPGENVSACVMPLLYSGGKFAVDASRFSVPVQGDPITGTSTSVPQLVNWGGMPLLYWTAGYQGAKAQTFAKVTRGTFLMLGTDGALWTPGSDGVSALASKGEIVADVQPGNPLSSYVHSVRSLYPAPNGEGYYIMSTRGGPGCTGPSSTGSGCWRTEVTFSPCPLGYDVFSSAPQPTDQIPVNSLDYPKTLTDPATGTRYLSASVYQSSGAAGYAPAVLQANTALLPWPADLP